MESFLQQEGGYLPIKIKITNPDLSGSERTYLSSDYSSGTSLTVGNNDNFTTDWFAVVGEPSQELTEIKRITGSSGNTIISILASLKFAHSKSTPVYLSQWDKVSFEQKPSGGSFAAISGSPFDIGWDNEDGKTLIIVSGGASTDTYRWRFYNSQLGTYSDYSDELAGTGLNRYKVGYLIQQIRKNPATQSVTDQSIIEYFNDYQTDVVYPEMQKAWWFKKQGSQVSTAVGDYDYGVLSNWSDFQSMDIMLYRYVNGSTNITYPLTFSPYQEFLNLKSDANQGNDDYAKYWTLLPPDSTQTKGYIGLHPTPSTVNCFLKPVYFYEIPDLGSFGDTIVVPFPKGYIDYALYRIFDDIKGDTGTADKYNARVQRGIVYLKRLARRQLGQPELLRFRGQRGWSRLYGEQGRLNSSESRELYW